jgi:DNA primase
MDDDAFRGEVIFTFDGDAAGQKAALRAFSEDQKFVTQTFVAVEPDGLDPCELRQEKGDLALRDLIARRVPLFEFAIRAELAHHKLDTAEGRVNALNAASPLVAQIRDKSLRPEYTRLLAGWLGVEVEIVTRAVAQGARTAPQQSRVAADEVPVQANFRPDPNEARLILEREVLKARLQEPQLFEGDIWSSIEAVVSAALGDLGSINLRKDSLTGARYLSLIIFSNFFWKFSELRLIISPTLYIVSFGSIFSGIQTLFVPIFLGLVPAGAGAGTSEHDSAIRGGI